MEKEKQKPLTAQDTALLLSRVLKDTANRKTTLRYAMAISRIALALAKVIEVADLNERVEFLEQVLKKKKQQ